MGSITTLLILLSCLIFSVLVIFVLICTSKHSKKNLNIEYYRTQCLKNENSLRRDEPTSYQMAVLNADKLVEQAMNEKGLSGQSMGEKLKNSPRLFSDLNGLWTSHKLRNQIAHEPNVAVSYEDAKRALAQFRRALKDLGAI